MVSRESRMVNAAVLYGFGTMVAWGFWIVLGDVASNSIDPKTAAFISYATAAVVTGVYVLTADASLAVTNRGLLFSAIAGVAAAVGVVSTFIGLTVGSTAVVSTIGGMYFVAAAVISVVALGQSIALNEVVGIGLAIAAIVVINL
jgi:transporter family protein